MRWLWVMVVVSVAGSAEADKKIVEMTPRYKKELAACVVQEGGVESILSRATSLVATDPPDKAEIDADIVRLDKGHAVLVAYCAEVKAMVGMLEANARTPYKSVQKEIAERDNAVRAARREARKWIDELAPITRKLIPRVNARVQRIEEKKSSGKFPSGRVVELPALSGSWKLGGNAVTDVAEYATDHATASVTTRPFSHATCDQQRKRFASKAGEAPITDLELGAPAKALGVEWGWRYVRRDRTPHLLTMMCVTVGTGGFVALADVAPVDRAELVDEMTKLMVAMLALQLPKPTAN